MSENEKKLKEEKKLGNLKEKLKGVKGQASDFEIKALKESIEESMEKIKKFKLKPGEALYLEDGKKLLPKEENKNIQEKFPEKKPGVGFPVLRFDENGKPITGGVKPKFLNKGGAVRKGDSETVKMYKHGGEVKSKKSKVAGRLAQRGYGKARK
jgi:hypothetical protein